VAEITLRPYAPVLIESMRATGYSLEAAIADLVDNSISAGANLINIQFRPFDDPYIAIIDDGCGMSADTLTEAMRHGRNPHEVRRPGDLGRFGLGLKTASLSQCRKLTVASCRDTCVSVRCWDLELVAEKVDWIVSEPDTDAEVQALPHIGEIAAGQGTIVLWQNLDRIAAGETSIEAALGAKMDRVREHLGLVFHRYLSGEARANRLRIEINGNPVVPIDPFLATHQGTQMLYQDIFQVEDHEIRVQPYILPHISKLTAEDLRLAGGEEGLRRNQGFYVYRDHRLILWGTWFRLARAEELTKLARVRVDIPNTLDHLWSLDIKKSSAHPPEIVRRNLARTVERIAERSRQTYTYRGRDTNRDDGVTHTWNRIQGRNGVAYCINRSHPILAALVDSLDGEQRRLMEKALAVIESTFPADSLYADIASDRPRDREQQTDPGLLRELALQLIAATKQLPGARHNLLMNLHLIEPFSHDVETSKQIAKELEHDQ
jgi:hypothetical protein